MPRVSTPPPATAIAPAAAAGGAGAGAAVGNGTSVAGNAATSAANFAGSSANNWVNTASVAGNVVNQVHRTANEGAGFATAVGGVDQSIQQGIEAGHQIAALMQQLSLAAALDSAMKKAGEQVKTAAQ